MTADTTREAVERLAARLMQQDEEGRPYNWDGADAAATLRALLTRAEAAERVRNEWRGLHKEVATELRRAEAERDAARAKALEDAARACDARSIRWAETDSPAGTNVARENEAGMCAAAIRALAQEDKP